MSLLSQIFNDALTYPIAYHTAHATSAHGRHHHLLRLAVCRWCRALSSGIPRFEYASSGLHHRLGFIVDTTRFCYHHP